jgi:hypothetical protein
MMGFVCKIAIVAALLCFVVKASVVMCNELMYNLITQTDRKK